jgi:Na+/melibiose symporter-like transporter
MRALCGAIISAGAMIGLGLTALGYGIRFQSYGPEATNAETHQLYGIASMTVILVVLLLAMLIGIGVAFMGLAFHHERRHRERLRDLGQHSHAA